MSKRLVIVALVLILAGLALTACGSDSEAPTSAPAALVLAPTATAPAAPPAALTYTTLSVQDAYARLQADAQAIIVDVREPQEWATTGIPASAALIPLAQIVQRAPAELPQDRPILLICNSGNRSRVAADALVKLGYSTVINVEGGIQAWLRAGLPVEAYAP